MNVGASAVLATVTYGPRDVRFEQVDDPKIVKPTDAIITLSATCICGSDLWPYRGLQPMDGPTNMGHEYCGVVVGSDVHTVRPGQFVVGSFCISDNTCPHCRYGFQSSCVQGEFMLGAQAPYARVPLADGTLVATAEVPLKDLIADLLATSDVLGTGWYAADAANGRRVDSGRRRRRCSWTHGRACRQGARRGTRHRHEPAQEPAGTRHWPRRDRHRRCAR